MKRYTWIVLAMVALGFTLTGCGNKGGVDTFKLESTFKSAEAAAKTAVDQAVTAIRSGDYSGALASLQKAAVQAKLTPEQTQAINDVIAQVQKMITDAAGKAAEGANKAVGDMQKSLPK